MCPQVAPGRDLCWPKHLQRPGILFRLMTADEDDSNLRDALTKDIENHVKVIIHHVILRMMSGQSRQYVGL